MQVCVNCGLFQHTLRTKTLSKTQTFSTLPYPPTPLCLSLATSLTTLTQLSALLRETLWATHDTPPQVRFTVLTRNIMRATKSLSSALNTCTGTYITPLQTQRMYAFHSKKLIDLICISQLGIATTLYWRQVRYFHSRQPLRMEIEQKEKKKEVFVHLFVCVWIERVIECVCVPKCLVCILLFELSCISTRRRKMFVMCTCGVSIRYVCWCVIDINYRNSLASSVCVAIVRQKIVALPSLFSKRPLSKRPLSKRPLSKRPLSKRPLSKRPLSTSLSLFSLETTSLETTSLETTSLSLSLSRNDLSLSLLETTSLSLSSRNDLSLPVYLPLSQWTHSNGLFPFQDNSGLAAFRDSIFRLIRGISLNVYGLLVLSCKWVHVSCFALYNFGAGEGNTLDTNL